jgi:hypothetical protein
MLLVPRITSYTPEHAVCRYPVIWDDMKGHAEMSVVFTYDRPKAEGKTVVMLIPSRTDTKYWHDYIMKATEIRFIKGRLKFGGSKNSAPFPSAIIIFKGVK